MAKSKEYKTERLFIGAINQTDLALLERRGEISRLCLILLPCLLAAAAVSAFKQNEFSSGRYCFYAALSGFSFILGFLYETPAVLSLKRLIIKSDKSFFSELLGVAPSVLAVAVIVFVSGIPFELLNYYASFSEVTCVALCAGGLGLYYIIYRVSAARSFSILGYGLFDSLALSWRASAVKGYFRFIVKIYWKLIVYYFLLTVLGALLLAAAIGTPDASSVLVIFASTAFASVIVWLFLRYFPRINLALIFYAESFVGYNNRRLNENRKV